MKAEIGTTWNRWLLPTFEHGFVKPREAIGAGAVRER
jgi:hypothetical protein